MQPGLAHFETMTVPWGWASSNIILLRAPVQIEAWFSTKVSVIFILGCLDFHRKMSSSRLSAGFNSLLDCFGNC